ncbi:hypothetical protein [Actinoplanes solisilvae]|uniref:hypothetical protein n=1 Tax=Actinoplanes solisilvae TaxID=2486853 RepID=UPI000FD74C35|nr:hypothetical protein [Actinoplanes solisilvae]
MKTLRWLVGLLTVVTVTLVAPGPAQAAVRCKTGSTTVGSPTGGLGATASARVCIDNYKVSLDPNHYNYVKDQKADGYAARAWFEYHDLDYGYFVAVGPLATDDTSTSTGTRIPNGGWPEAGTDVAAVWVCLGLTRPGPGSLDRCSQIVVEEYWD